MKKPTHETEYVSAVLYAIIFRSFEHCFLSLVNEIGFYEVDGRVNSSKPDEKKKCTRVKKDYFSLVSNIFELIARGVREENAVKCPVRIPTNERAIYYLNEYSLCVCLFLTARGLI